MQFMVIRKADAETEAGALPSKQLIDDMTAYNEKLVAKGMMKSGGGLTPSARGARVSFSNGKPTVIDGPFAEAKELIGGFAILEVDSLAEAVEHARKFALLVGSERVDVRRVVEFEDLQQDPQ